MHRKISNEDFRKWVSESLLEDFAHTISKLDRSALQRLRAECVAKLPGPDADDDFLDVIDGNIALRDINELPDCELAD